MKIDQNDCQFGILRERRMEKDETRFRDAKKERIILLKIKQQHARVVGSLL